MRPVLLVLALAALAPIEADAGLCLRVEAGGGPVATFPVADGEEVRLAFRHSLYGSPVEEAFRVSPEGFRLVGLRYGEERLVEFYGHEGARREGDWWIVEAEGPARATLDLRASPESRVRVTVGPRRIPLGEGVEPGRRVRLAVAACGEAGHGR
ncbi:MAG: DUF1850 domain-containing protein [candidate division NC10 bacterium]|nr:DUF1850 domain-containing protein [candidate division NC10 bacterium]